MKSQAHIWSHERLVRQIQPISKDHPLLRTPIFPWAERVETNRVITEFGVIWVNIDGAKAVAEHQHDEEESFLVLEGRGRLDIGGETFEIGAGDAVYIPRNLPHALTNISYSAPFIFLDVYWDAGGDGNTSVI